MNTVSKKMKGLTVSVAGAALLGLFTLPAPAQAGFEWTPPPAQVAAPAIMPAEAAPVVPEETTGPLTPDPDAAAPVVPVSEAMPLQSNDLPVPESQASESAAIVSKPAEKTVVQPEPVAKPSQPTASSDLDMSPVQGFGKDLPLAIALRQIAPAQYAYRFEQGVSAGQKVSWQGGKPWPHVLSDMLAESGLQVVIVGNVISVQRSGTPTADAPAEKSVEAEQAMAAPVADKVEEPAQAPAKETSDDLPVPRTAYVPGSASAPEASGAPTNIQTEAQVAEATELQAADEVPVATVAAPTDKVAPVVDIQSSRRWEAEPGRTLRETLEKWSSSAGAEIEWMSPYDYPVEHAFVFNGKFDDAVESLLALYSRETPRPRGRLYPNLPTGPSVLMVN